MAKAAPHVVIIGAGIGGLSAAMRLAHGGVKVTVLERHNALGGKIRTVPSQGGPIDAGPTVLTLKPVFDALFSEVGLSLEDHVTLVAQDTLARHFWPDGTTLDLMHSHAESHENVHHAFGAKAAQEFSAFSDRARTLYDTFNVPMMQSATPNLLDLTRVVAKSPRLIPLIDPLRSYATSLNRHFSEPRLAQLFARYATYIGGLPASSPALLALIWHAESRGVWHVKGGMHELARAIAANAASFGAEFRYNTHVTRIETQGGKASAVHTKDARITVDAVLFNGDPDALRSGHFGPAVSNAFNKSATSPRSLSANVMSFAATPNGADLAAHNVFFARDPDAEYPPLARGDPQIDPTLYVCAQDRFEGQPSIGPERFEIILNSAPINPAHPHETAQTEKVRQQCQTMILDRLSQFDLTFSPRPTPQTVTLPQDFDTMFPASAGSLYGRSPHGMMAAFKRPTARTTIPGLYLTGGGAHPGAGLPMATLSGKHAAAAILHDLPSTSTSPPVAMHGGTSTASATTAPAPFPSSPL